jgi:hypothetical protein
LKNGCIAVSLLVFAALFRSANGPLCAQSTAGRAQNAAGRAQSTEGRSGVPSVRVALVMSTRPTAYEESALRGARLGEAEARRTAEMMNGTYALRVLSLTNAFGPGAVRALDSAQVILSTLSQTDLERLRSVAGRQLILDLTPIGPDPDCDARILHVSAPASSLSAATLWSSRLDRFGAQQLNERFARASGHPMDDAAWAAWFATKVALELAMRSHSNDPDSIVRLARSNRLHFDGQKGRPLAFDARTGILLQPLYTEVPGGAPTESTHEPELPPCRARAP